MTSFITFKAIQNNKIYNAITKCKICEIINNQEHLHFLFKNKKQTALIYLINPLCCLKIQQANKTVLQEQKIINYIYINDLLNNLSLQVFLRVLFKDWSPVSLC